MRSLILAAAISVVMAVPATAATRTVRVDDDYFVRSGSAPTVTVSRYTVVKWRWRGTRRHNVAVQTGPAYFRSTTKRSGKYKKTMRTRGSYRIVCTIHEPDMRMRLVVE
jgi:plastocyanin